MIPANCKDEGIIIVTTKDIGKKYVHPKHGSVVLAGIGSDDEVFVRDEYGYINGAFGRELEPNVDFSSPVELPNRIDLNDGCLGGYLAKICVEDTDVIIRIPFGSLNNAKSTCKSIYKAHSAAPSRGRRFEFNETVLSRLRGCYGYISKNNGFNGIASVIVIPQVAPGYIVEE